MLAGLFCLLFIWFSVYNLWKLYLDRLEGYYVELLLFQLIFNFSMSQHGLEAVFGFCSFDFRFVLNLFFLDWSFPLPFLPSFSFSCILFSFSSSSLISGLAFLLSLTWEQAFSFDTGLALSPLLFDLRLSLSYVLHFYHVLFYMLSWHCYFLAWSPPKGIYHSIYHSEFLNTANHSLLHHQHFSCVCCCFGPKAHEFNSSWLLVAICKFFRRFVLFWFDSTDSNIFVSSLLAVFFPFSIFFFSRAFQVFDL